MTILDQIKAILKGKEGYRVSSSQIKKELKAAFGTNPSSVMISDYCYNRTNDGINFEQRPHLFKYLARNEYEFLGENYKYTGKIFHKPINRKIREYGEWISGRLVIYP